ncbi:Alpha/Beta hydrolase protein [Mycena olivaceomarginata]|nr:Alpha/Beta hydrolase protein [Mycena olivaceomarginata]
MRLSLTWQPVSASLQPFRIDLAREIPRLKSLLNNTRLPAKALYSDAGPQKGIELDVLRDLKTERSTTFDWEAQQAELSQLAQFAAVVEEQTVHFVHKKSTNPDAIPLILLHGWPGSFHEFLPIVKPLTQVNEKNASPNVVVPSLPGFVFSSAPPANWIFDDTARIFNTLMTDVLGYSVYALHGTDWGGAEMAGNNITLSEIQRVTQEFYIEWRTTGMGYFIEQTTKPNDIGLPLYDSPVGQLAWIGRKFKLWSDPRAGTPPSVLTNTPILTSISLYFLTESFSSSVWSYAQNPDGIKAVYSRAPTDAPLLFSQFPYNLVHDLGGHFAGLDNPPALIEDIREIAMYFNIE